MLEAESMKKGISPLIAAVLLIAFTMAIAGIMASWATTFSGQKLGSPYCPLALNLDSLSFNNNTGNLTILLKNGAKELNLTGFVATVYYKDSTVTNYNLADYGLLYLNPLHSVSVKVDTKTSEKPEKVSITSETCPNYPSERKFS